MKAQLSELIREYISRSPFFQIWRSWMASPFCFHIHLGTFFKYFHSNFDEEVNEGQRLDGLRDEWVTLLNRNIAHPLTADVGKFCFIRQPERLGNILFKNVIECWVNFYIFWGVYRHYTVVEILTFRDCCVLVHNWRGQLENGCKCGGCFKSYSTPIAHIILDYLKNSPVFTGL